MRSFSLLFVSLLMLGGCSSEPGPGSTTEEKALLEAPAAPPPPEAPGPTDGAASSETEPATSATPTASRKLVYHATVRMRVGSVPQANNRLDSLIRKYGGYVEAASEEKEDGQWTHETQIRIAPTHFQALLGHLNGLGTLESKTLRTDDVTAEHADVSARIKAKRTVEQRYLALLGQAKKVSDILEIEEKLGEVREAIESTESRLKTLDQEVAYSTIALTYFQLLPQPTPDPPIISFRSRVAESFYAGWELFTAIILGAITAWPLLLIGSVAVVLWYRRRRRRTAPQGSIQ